MTETVADIPDEELLRRAVANARSPNYRKGEWHPLWVAVSEIFQLGRTSSGQLCERFGFQPDAEVKR